MAENETKIRKDGPLASHILRARELAAKRRESNSNRQADRESYLDKAEKDEVRLDQYLQADEKQRGKLVNDDEYIPGVPLVAGDLYPKLPTIHQKLIGYLEEQGYEVKDTTKPDKDSQLHRDDLPPEVKRKEGWPTGFVHLKDDVLKRAGKCKSCGSYISQMGIEVNGHKCEKCGSVTYEKFPKGSQVKFGIWRAPERVTVVNFTEGGDAIETPISGELLRDACLVVEGYDPKEKLLYCYAELAEVKKEGIDFGRVEETYKKLADSLRANRIIVSDDEVSDVSGSKYNFRIVQLYKGKEFGEYEELPISDMFSVYEPWHYAPLVPSPGLHNRIISAAHMVNDIGYYYQDGRTAFYSQHLESMRRFVEHFTSLDLTRWDEMVARAPKSARFIEAIGRYCHSDPMIINRPNIGNVIVGLADSMQGKQKTRDQIEAEIAYLKSEGFDGNVNELLEYLREMGLIPREENIKRAREQEKWIQGIWDSLNIE